MRFLDDVIQVALDVEAVEGADFSDYATYTVERYDYIVITPLDASAADAAPARVYVSFYKSSALEEDYLRLSYDSRRGGFIAGYYTRQESGGAEGGE